MPLGPTRTSVSDLLKLERKAASRSPEHLDARTRKHSEAANDRNRSEADGQLFDSEGGKQTVFFQAQQSRPATSDIGWKRSAPQASRLTVR